MLGTIKSGIKSGLKDVRQGIVGKYATPRVAGTDSYYAAQEDKALAEERASASLSAPPKSGISGLIPKTSVGPSIFNMEKEAMRKQRSEQQIAAFLESARARNAKANANAAKANINARIAAHTPNNSLPGSKISYPTGLNALRNRSRATRKVDPFYHPGAAGGKRTRRRKTHRKHKRTHKRHRSNK